MEFNHLQTIEQLESSYIEYLDGEMDTIITVSEFLQANDVCNPTWKKADYLTKMKYCDQLLSDAKNEQDFNFCIALKIVAINRYYKKKPTTT